MVEVDTTELEKYIERKCLRLEESMLKECKLQMRIEIGNHIDTGETISSIRSIQNGYDGEVLVSGAAVWLEFGTGVAKNSSLHPMAAELGMSPHGTYGKGNGANPNGWNFPTKEGTWRHTKGIKQTRFMYKAGKYIKKNVVRMAKWVFD